MSVATNNSVLKYCIVFDFISNAIRPKILSFLGLNTFHVLNLIRDSYIFIFIFYFLVAFFYS